MEINANYRSIIHHAQLGNQQSMERLAKLVEPRIFAYIYRLTLDYDVAQDLLQETLLEMLRSLNELEHTDRFWFWLFRTALGKVQHYFRAKKRKRTIQMSAINKEKERISQRISGDYNDGLDNLVRRELSDAIFEAMTKLKFRHRNVLVLRCFEQMPYAEIAAIMDCSELHSRVLFFRAKNSLRRQLSRHGFSKRFMITALALFGLITTSAKAASATSTVSGSSLEVGLAATLIGSLVSKLGLALAAAITTLALAWGLETFLCVAVIVCFTALCLGLIYLATIYG